MSKVNRNDVESRDAPSQSRKATAKSHSILWITAGVRRSATLMLMRGVTELFNKRRLNSAARYTAAAYGLLMHYSSANAATCTVVARRCCALTWPKLRRGGQKRSKPTWMLTPKDKGPPLLERNVHGRGNVALALRIITRSLPEGKITCAIWIWFECCVSRWIGKVYANNKPGWRFFIRWIIGKVVIKIYVRIV